MIDDDDSHSKHLFAVNSPPRIIKQPPTDEMLFQVAQQGENDKPFIIECEAEGEPQPK
jgi:neuronal cell adhesion molecule